MMEIKTGLWWVHNMVEIKTGLWWYIIWWRLKLAVKKLKVHIWKPRPANFINRSRPPEVRATNLITNFKI